MQCTGEGAKGIFIAHFTIDLSDSIRKREERSISHNLRLAFLSLLRFPSGWKKPNQGLPPNLSCRPSLPGACNLTRTALLKVCDSAHTTPDWIAVAVQPRKTPFLSVQRNELKKKKVHEIMDSEFHLRAATTTSGGGAHLPRIKPPPQTASIPAPFTYSPSDDGTDENLLILLHGLGSHRPSFSVFFFFLVFSFQHGGVVFFSLFFFFFKMILFVIQSATLGDTHVPFSKLGRSFKLPQTATLSLRAPEQCVTIHTS